MATPERTFWSRLTGTTLQGDGRGAPDVLQRAAWMRLDVGDVTLANAVEEQQVYLAGQGVPRGPRGDPRDVCA